MTEGEKAQLFVAAARTWSSISSDAAEIGATTLQDAVELVLDADRIVSIGRLPENLYKKVMESSEAEDCLLKYPRQWF